MVVVEVSFACGRVVVVEEEGGDASSVVVGEASSPGATLPRSGSEAARALHHRERAAATQ